MNDPIRAAHIGAEAARVLNSEFVDSVLDAMEERWITAWRNTKPNESSKREELWAMYAGCKAFRSELTALVNRGRIASDQVEQRRAKNDRGLTGPQHVLPTG